MNTDIPSAAGDGLKLFIGEIEALLAHNFQDLFRSRQLARLFALLGSKLFYLLLQIHGYSSNHLPPS